jgi:predicted anti-sigma-YlaC factor YlaD
MSAQAHLRRCSRCRAWLRGLEGTVALARSLGREPAAPLPEDLVQAILAARAAEA